MQAIYPFEEPSVRAISRLFRHNSKCYSWHIFKKSWKILLIMVIYRSWVTCHYFPPVILSVKQSACNLFNASMIYLGSVPISCPSYHYPVYDFLLQGQKGFHFGLWTFWNFELHLYPLEKPGVASPPFHGSINWWEKLRSHKTTDKMLTT